MGRRMMRALGAGLMEAGRQSELSRKEQLELKRQQNLKDIADGRQGIMREQVGLMRQRLTNDEASKKREREVTAINSVQERLDKMRVPGDQYLDEYLMTRAGIIKNGADMDATELMAQLQQAEDAYKANRLAELDPETAEYASREKELKTYMKQMNSFLDTANRKLSKTVDSWTGDVADYLYTTPTYDAELAEQEGMGDAPPPPPPSATPPEERGIMGRFMQGSVEPSAVPGEGRKMGREYGLMSAEGVGGLGRKIYGGGEFDPYFSIMDTISSGYQKHIGRPFERLMIGDPNYKPEVDENGTPKVPTPDIPQIPGA